MISFFSYFLTPAASTVMSYVPGCICGNTNRPSTSVVLVVVVFLLCSTAVILALPTAACVASRTVPAIEPETVWPNPYADRRITANNAATNFVGRITTPLVLIFMACPARQQQCRPPPADS